MRRRQAGDTGRRLAGELSMMLKWAPPMYLSAMPALGGFSLVILAAAIVIVEGLIIHRQLDAELVDVPDLAGSTGQGAGVIGDEKRAKRRLGVLGRLSRGH